MEIATRSDSAAKDMKNLMMVTMIKTGPLNIGVGLFYGRNMWDLARLHDKR